MLFPVFSCSGYASFRVHLYGRVDEPAVDEFRILLHHSRVSLADIFDSIYSLSSPSHLDLRFWGEMRWAFPRDPFVARKASR